jgi:hypothetical protein
VIVAYWIVAGVLALFYLYAGAMKAFRSREALLPMMTWVETAPMAFVRTVGALELLGVIGLIVPPLTGIAPWLALAAAIGLLLVQIGAIILHVRRGEARKIGINVGLLVVAAACVWLATIWL